MTLPMERANNLELLLIYKMEQLWAADGSEVTHVMTRRMTAGLQSGATYEFANGCEATTGLL